MILCKEDPQYWQQVKAYFDQMLPEKIYDAHFHLCRRYTERTKYAGTPWQQYLEFMTELLGREPAGGLMMSMPDAADSMANFRDDQNYILGEAKVHGFEMGLMLRPNSSPEETAATLEQNPEIKALKTYLCYSMHPDHMEADILDFTPPWVWEIANQREMPVIIHLSHYQNMLNDPNNIRDLHHISRNFPKAKIWLAHCALGHHVHKLKMGLEQIRDLPNVCFDCSGVSEAVSIAYCIKAFGAEKVMFGGDYNFAATSGRIACVGSNFVGLHRGYVQESVMAPDYRFQPMSSGVDSLLALLQASELLQLDQPAVEGIFYDNAAQLLK